MASTTTPKIILGCGAIGDTSDPWAKYTTPAAAQAYLNVFRQAGYVELDTARAYSPHAPGSCEPILGATDVAAWAVLDTKIPPRPGSGTKEQVEESVRLSLESLQVDKVHIMYIHAPDRTTPFAETFESLDVAYRAGKFAELGLSNFSPREVEDCVALCKDKGWVVPTVYQGHYNAVARGGEAELFPLLRRLGIRFYAYSPSAGGIFSGKVNKDTATPGGRWDPAVPVGALYRTIFLHPAILSATAAVHSAAQAHGLTGHAVAVRWLLHHSALDAGSGDGIVVGASSLAQLEENLAICSAGPLPRALVQAVEEVGVRVREAGCLPKVAISD